MFVYTEKMKEKAYNIKCNCLKNEIKKKISWDFHFLFSNINLCLVDNLLRQLTVNRSKRISWEMDAFP